MAEDNPFGQDGEDGTTVEFEAKPSEQNAGTTANFSYRIEVGNSSNTQNLNARVKVFLYVNGTKDARIVASEKIDSEENETITGGLSHTLAENKKVRERNQTGINARDVPEKFNSYPRTDEPVWIKVEVDYWSDGSGPRRGNVDEVASTKDASVKVLNPFDDPESTAEQVPDAGENTLGGTFADRTPFSVKEIEFEDDASYLSSIFTEDEKKESGYRISFDYPNPTVAIDGSGRFAKHEIVGGSTVRQKIGEDPVNVSVNGVCKRRTANQIDSLRDAKSGKIYSDRLPGENDALRVQFGSTSTEPMTDGGAADVTDGKYLYSFQLNCIEVIR